MKIFAVIVAMVSFSAFAQDSGSFDSPKGGIERVQRIAELEQRNNNSMVAHAKPTRDEKAETAATPAGPTGKTLKKKKQKKASQ